MSNYVITTDFTADYSEEFYNETKISRLVLPFNLGKDEYDLKNTKIDFHTFYQSLRDGVSVVTSQVSQYDAKIVFSEYLKQGLDIIHFSFSSGCSSSYVSFNSTINELKEEFPDNKIYIIDSLAGAGALGIFVDKAYKLQQSGMSFDDLIAWAEDSKLKLRHYFIVDDLKFLKKSGRLSGIEATIGSILGIKPVLALDINGKIKPVAKPRGTKKAYLAMRDYLIGEFDKDNNDYIMVGHGDNIENAHKLAAILEEAVPGVKIIYNNVSHLIGAHAGPDCLALFFYAKTNRTV